MLIESRVVFFCPSELQNPFSGAFTVQQCCQLWSTKFIDEDVGVFETTIVDLDARAKQSKSTSLEAAKKEEEDHAAEIRERKYEKEMRLEKEKLQQRLKYEKQIEDSRKD